jgi:hypothetical protein
MESRGMVFFGLLLVIMEIIQSVYQLVLMVSTGMTPQIIHLLVVMDMQLHGMGLIGLLLVLIQVIQSVYQEVLMA